MRRWRRRCRGDRPARRRGRPVGQDETDELAYSLSGTNAHYGTPGRRARSGARGIFERLGRGGSRRRCTLGSGDVTGGSVRVPASAYRGIYGLRPTHGRIDIRGRAPGAEASAAGAAGRRRRHLEEAAGMRSSPGSHPAITTDAASIWRLVVATDLLDQADDPASTEDRRGWRLSWPSGSGVDGDRTSPAGPGEAHNVARRLPRPIGASGCSSMKRGSALLTNLRLGDRDLFAEDKDAHDKSAERAVDPRRRRWTLWRRRWAKTGILVQPATKPSGPGARPGRAG